MLFKSGTTICIMKTLRNLSILACIFLMSCNFFKGDKEEKADYIKYMKMLPEIEEADKDIKDATDQKNGISFLEGETENGLIYYSAGFSGDEKFETYYRIRINPEKKTMEMEDLASGEWKTVLKNW